MFIFTSCQQTRENKSTKSTFQSFPIGLYGVEEKGDIEDLSKLGFNTIISQASYEKLQIAKDSQVNIISSLPPKLESINELDNHPNLLSWYIWDEPGLHVIDPSKLIDLRRNLKSRGMTKPMSIASWHSDKLRFYIDSVDLILVDRYPIPWMPVSDVGHHVRLAKATAGRERPIFAVLQAFSWDSHPNLSPGNFHYRIPSYDELRGMAYDAISQGASGILFYTYKSSKWSLVEHPALWASVQILVEDLHKYEDLFLSPRIWAPLKQRFKPYDKRFNERGFSAISSAFFKINKSNDYWKPGIYMLAVNSTREKLDYSFTLKGWDQLPEFETQSLTNGDSLSSNEGWLSDEFGPLQVRIYGPLPRW